MHKVEYPKSTFPKFQEPLTQSRRNRPHSTFAPAFQNYDFASARFGTPDVSLMPLPSYPIGEIQTASEDASDFSEFSREMENPGVSNNRDFSALTPALREQILHVGNNLGLRAKPYFGPSFGLGSTEHVPGATRDLRQGQSVTLRESGDYSMFPDSNGAGAGFSGLARSNHYQALVDQPQLHFGVGTSANLLSRSRMPYEQIRTDVEVLNKRRPRPPPAAEDDEDDEEDGHNDENENGDDDERDSGEGE